MAPRQFSEDTYRDVGDDYAQRFWQYQMMTNFGEDSKAQSQDTVGAATGQKEGQDHGAQDCQPSDSAQSSERPKTEVEGKEGSKEDK